MTIEQLRKAIAPATFKPFSLHLSDGHVFHVDHPEWVLVAPKAERTFVVADRDGSYSVIDLLHVTRFDFDDNGRSRSSRRKSA